LPIAKKADEHGSSLPRSRRISPQQFKTAAVGMGLAHPPAEGSISICAASGTPHLFTIHSSLFTIHFSKTKPPVYGRAS